MENQVNNLVNQPCYDKAGNFIGWYSRSVAVVGFVFCKDKQGVWHVLGSERGAGTPDHQGMWNCPCGYLDFNETTMQAICREVKEEVGIIINESDVEFIGYEDVPTANRQNITFRFAVVINDKTIDALPFSHEGNEENEVGDIRWIALTDLGQYEWAFGHGKRIIEIATLKGLV